HWHDNRYEGFHQSADGSEGAIRGLNRASRHARFHGSRNVTVDIAATQWMSERASIDSRDDLDFGIDPVLLCRSVRLRFRPLAVRSLSHRCLVLSPMTV